MRRRNQERTRRPAGFPVLLTCLFVSLLSGLLEPGPGNGAAFPGASETPLPAARAPLPGGQMPGTQDEILLAGMESLMNAHFEESLSFFEEVIRRAPDDPAGYFFRAGAYWWLVARDPSETHYDELLLEHLAEAIDIGEDRRRLDEDDPHCLLYLGGAYGFRARYSVLRKSWLRAARDARRGVKLLRRAVELEPELYDAYLGLGMYDYYASALPAYVKAIQVLFLVPGGDRERGLEELELARERGTFTQAEAQFFLVDIYLDYEKRYQEALRLTVDLRQRYPDNPYFHLLEAVIHTDRVGSFSRAQQLLTDLMRRADEGKCPFAEDIALRSRYYLGKTHLWRREYEEALRRFEELLLLDPPHPSWLVPWVWFRVGQTYDLMGRREEALEAYREVLDRPEVGKLHDYARDRQEEPFTMGGR